jgi:hypothetical protein
MSAELKLDGVDAARAWFRALAAGLATEATAILDAAAADAASAIVAGYPSRSGSLRAGVYVDKPATPTAVAQTRVNNRLPLAYLFEIGTQARHNSLGANRGAMPAGHVFIPVMARTRRRVTAQLVALVEHAGLDVHGG